MTLFQQMVIVILLHIHARITTIGYAQALEDKIRDMNGGQDI